VSEKNMFVKVLEFLNDAKKESLQFCMNACDLLNYLAVSILVIFEGVCN